MSENLVDVVVDVDRRVPGVPAVGRTRDAADVDVDEERVRVARRRHRTDLEWYADRVPPVATGDGVECGEGLEPLLFPECQDTSIGGSCIDGRTGTHDRSQVGIEVG